MPAKKPQIVVLEGYPLQNFMEMLTGSRNLPGSLYRLRIRPTAKGFGMEFKVNEGEWTAPMGHSDLREQFGTATHEALEAAERDRRQDPPDEFGEQIQASYDRLRGDSKGGFH